MVWGGRREGGSGLGTSVHPWWIHVDVWQNQYSIVEENKVKYKKKMRLLPKELCLLIIGAVEELPVMSLPNFILF